MSDQPQINGALEARVAELEQQLAALQEGRPAARSRMSRRRVAAFGVMLALLAVPGVVVASHQFPDVPTGGFHDDIDWLADYGITTGYGDGTFRPNQAVTRQAMAAFMHRLSNQFEVVHSDTDPAQSANFGHSVTCPDDKRAIAGGGFVGASNIFMTTSYPTSTSTWQVVWESDDDHLQNPAILTVYALCAPRL